MEERNKLNNFAVTAKPFKSMDSGDIKKPANCSKSTSLSQRESESLQAMAVGLRTEWYKLKAEMDNLLKKCERVKDENKSIMEELTKIYGRDAISHLIAMESESDNDEETTLSEQN
ncbi:hypothetical protein DKX38_006258 [Salix brachista]|uniref:BZIP domain-containing protein n=1 Tax=Salix brachista TaxID=2182728 RepID=A0A5N5N4B5_9ROSI|nr:hypothetical protein DKX38_006258 [Salix brachista]